MQKMIGDPSLGEVAVLQFTEQHNGGRSSAAIPAFAHIGALCLLTYSVQPQFLQIIPQILIAGPLGGSLPQPCWLLPTCCLLGSGPCPTKTIVNHWGVSGKQALRSCSAQRHVKMAGGGSEGTPLGDLHVARMQVKAGVGLNQKVQDAEGMLVGTCGRAVRKS